jgi:hypothetical protein
LPHRLSQPAALAKVPCDAVLGGLPTAPAARGGGLVVG